MRLPATFCSLALMAALSGCGSVVIQSNAPGDGGTAPTDNPAASTDNPATPTDNPAVVDRPIAVLDRPGPIDLPIMCLSDTNCPRGSTCVGPQGCGVAWTCQPALGRPCTDDLAPFCGCDGVTFRGSSSCPVRPYLHRGECMTSAVDAGPSPAMCRGNVDCSAGQQCVGPEGCGVPWYCRAVSACTRDLTPYCSCDGSTFMASSTCPGRPYFYRGACRTVPDAGPATCVIEGVTCRVGEPCAIGGCRLCTCGADGTVGCSLHPDCAVDGGFRDSGGGPVDCTADDARGVGACAAFFGYAWNGTRCAGLSGCSCVGSACSSLAFSLELCNYNHRACL